MTYEVGGTVTKGDITYTDGGTSTTQNNGVKLPWKKKFTAKGSDVLVYQVMAQNATTGGGKITCRITVDGKVVKTNASTGAASIATCDYTPK